MPTFENAKHGKAFLFFSVDIVESVSYKTVHFKEWVVDFQRKFYEDFRKALETECGSGKLPGGRDLQLPPPEFWKHTGDELLYYVDVANAYQLWRGEGECTDLPKRKYELALYYAYAFTHTIRHHNCWAYRELTENGRAFLLKGTAWFASVAETESYDDAIGNIMFRVADHDAEGGLRPDFIGRHIDIGFRIAKHATANRFVLSVEYAILLLRDNYITVEDAGLGLYSDGRKPIKGILEHIGYPILYADMGDRFEHAEQAVEGTLSEPANAVSLTRYLQEYIKRTNNLVRYPFIDGDALFGRPQSEGG
jgi:hypothetical protein